MTGKALQQARGDYFSAAPATCCAYRHYRFRLYAESLSLCLRERESNQRESAPGIRVSLRETSLAPVLLRGSSRWAIPGPSFLVWHPCQTLLYTAPPLGLLTGPGIEALAKFVGAVLTAKLLTAPGNYGAKYNHWRQCDCLATRYWDIATKKPRRPLRCARLFCGLCGGLRARGWAVRGGWLRCLAARLRAVAGRGWRCCCRAAPGWWRR